MNPALWLVINPESGSNAPETVSAVTAALAAAGHAPARTVPIGQGMPTAAELDRASVGTVAVLAGDGTVNAVANALEGSGRRLLVLPGGTANLLARELHGDRPADVVARNFAALAVRRRTCIRTNFGTALIEVLAGPGAIWSEVREEMRGGDVSSVAGKTVEAIRQSTSAPRVELLDPKGGNPAGYAGVRLEATDAGIWVEGFAAETVSDYLQQGIALLRRNFREGPHDDLGHHAAVRCRSLGNEPIALMIDGERREGSAQERFLLAPFALDLLASPG